jgi:hypothetical protein
MLRSIISAIAPLATAVLGRLFQLVQFESRRHTQEQGRLAGVGCIGSFPIHLHKVAWK